MFRAEIVWISVFLAIGAIGGVAYNWPSTEVVATEDAPRPSTVEPLQHSIDDVQNELITPETEAVRENPQPATETLEAEPKDDVESSSVWSDVAPENQRSQPIDLSVLELGDRLLMGGNSMGAYKHYTKLWQRADLPLDSAVLIRLALASETAGLLEQSEKHYRAAIRVSEKGSVAQLTSLLGTARVWERLGQLDDSIALLSEMFLMHAHEGSPEVIRQSIIRQLADCLQRRLIQTDVVSQALDAEPMEYHWCPLVLSPILDLADLELSPANNQSIGSGIKVLQNPRGDASLILVNAQLNGISILAMLADLERQSGIRFNITEKAKSSLVGRLTNVNSSAMSVSLLLDQALETLMLSWSQGEDGITVMHRDELSQRDSASFELARVQRMLQQVQLNFPNGVERTAAIMNDGNNTRLSGGWDSATDKYRAAREANPTNELSAKLFFNESSLSMVRGEKLNALHSSYMALDQTLSGKLQAHVYSMIADLELEFGQPSKAITAASRAVRRANDPKVLTRSAMTLARAYLLNDDPDSANTALFDSSDQLTGDKNRRLASVFGSFARFQRVKPKHGLQDEGQRLVMALAALDPQDVNSFADALIVSRAYISVGLRSNATESLQRALDVAPAGYWSETIRYELAKMHYDASSLEQARSTVEGFQSIAVERLPKVLLLHSAIQLDQGNIDQCESICRRVLRLDADQATKAEALDRLGKTLQTKGDHYAAALCFAGLLPDHDADLPGINPDLPVSQQ